MKLSFVTVARLFAAPALFACGTAQAADVRVMI